MMAAFKAKKRRRLFRKQITKELFFQSRCKEVQTKQLEYEDQLIDIIMNAPLENQYFFNPKGSSLLLTLRFVYCY